MKPATTTFTAHRVRQLRRKAARAAQVSEDRGSYKWSVSPINVMEVLAVFTSLRIRNGYTLNMYQYRSGGGGNGFVYAVPAEGEFPEPTRLDYRLSNPPKPPNCLDHYMEAIEGDGTPLSYLQASILKRELKELGAEWHGCHWVEQYVLDRDPWKDERVSSHGLQSLIGPQEFWHFQGQRLTDWQPTVVQDAQAVTVSMPIFGQVGSRTITRYIDSYRSGSYQFETEYEDIADGGGGIIW